MNRILLIAVFLALSSLACSGSLLDSIDRNAVDVSPTEQALPSPINSIAPTGTASTTPAPSTCVVTAAESLYMRDAPGMAGIVITWLKPGDQLILLPDPSSGAWVKVQFENFTGWINSHYCERITP